MNDRERDSKGFRPGDTVRLKSGGPNMTVRGPGEYAGTVVCDWFFLMEDGCTPVVGAAQKADYHEAQLMKAVP